MDQWIIVRKGGEAVHVSYGHTYSNNLLAHNTRVRKGMDLEIRVDFNPNLRGRSKETETYLDARELASNEIQRLSLYQTSDEQLLNILTKIQDQHKASAHSWILTIELEGEWSFRAKPVYTTSGNLTTLSLHVLGQA